MKILGFYITRTDWHYQCSRLANSLEKALDKLYAMKERCADCQRYKSKQKLMTEQLRREVAERKYVPSDQVPHYDDIKKAVKLKEFGE